MVKVKWDAGIEEKNEWVYASVENTETTSRLKQWLTSKEKNEDEEALLVSISWNEIRRIKWGDILNRPELYFSETPFQLVGIKHDWILTYQKEGIARFGHFKQT